MRDGSRPRRTRVFCRIEPLDRPSASLSGTIRVFSLAATLLLTISSDFVTLLASSHGVLYQGCYMTNHSRMKPRALSIWSVGAGQMISPSEFRAAGARWYSGIATFCFFAFGPLGEDGTARFMVVPAFRSGPVLVEAVSKLRAVTALQDPVRLLLPHRYRTVRCMKSSDLYVPVQCWVI